MKLFRIGIVAWLGLASACSPGPAPVSRSLKDPSNAGAAEGVTPGGSAAMGMASPAGSGQQPSGDQDTGHNHTAAPASAGATTTLDAGAAAIVYTCPMHPQITSPSPGRCPICGMNLVPKK